MQKSCLKTGEEKEYAFTHNLNLAFICLFILCQAAPQSKQLEAES